MQTYSIYPYIIYIYIEELLLSNYINIKIEYKKITFIKNKLKIIEMKNSSNYDEINLDSKKDTLIDIKSQKDENIPFKNDSTDTSFSDSMDQMNSLIVKEKPIINNNSSVITKNRKGNTLQYFFDKEGSPLIVIGPDCKKILFIIQK